MNVKIDDKITNDSNDLDNFELMMNISFTSRYFLLNNYRKLESYKDKIEKLKNIEQQVDMIQKRIKIAMDVGELQIKFMDEKLKKLNQIMKIISDYDRDPDRDVSERYEDIKNLLSM